MSQAGQPATAASVVRPRSARTHHRPPADPAYARTDADYASPGAVSPGAGEPRLLRCGDLVLDEARWTAHRAGTPVDLSPTEFRLLACLMRHQGSVLTRSQLLQDVWGGGYTGHAQVVETYVSYLRRKLDRLGPPLIRTRRGLGYALGGPQNVTGPDLTAPRLAPGDLMP